MSDRPATYRRPRRPAVPGVKYRQLDYWAKKGLLKPAWEKPDRPGGHGNFRIWPAEELRVAEDIGRLRAAGVELRRAHDVARLGRVHVEDCLAGLPGGAP